MQILRTPDERFEGLDAWPFAPRYTQISGQDGSVLRVHHVDEGPSEAAPILLMHGEPTWSYLYRKFIPNLTAKGHRVVCPDLIGFGRSDKLGARSDYTYERHVAWMSAWLLANDLKDITLFCQDWGGLIGLRLVAAFPDRFARLVIANTGLPVGTGSSEGFDNWLTFSQTVPEFPVSLIVDMGTVRSLTDAEKAAYDAPFPDETYKEGARQFPTLVPITPEHASVAENIEAWKVLSRFTDPVLTCFSDSDPVSKGGEKVFIEKMPGAKGQPHLIIEKGGHFLQEDQPEQLCDLIDAFIRQAS